MVVSTPFDFSSYRVEDHEHPASAGKYNNLLFAIQTGLNQMPVASLVGYPGDAGKFLNGNAGWTLPTTDLSAIYTKTDETQVVDTIAATDLFGGSLSIAGGRLGSLGSIRIFAGGLLKQDTAAARTITLSLLLGGVPLWTSISANIPEHNTQRAWRFKAIIQAMGSTTAQQGGGLFLLSHSDKATTGTGALRASAAEIQLGPFLTVAGTVDMAASQTLALQVTFSLKSSDFQMTCSRARVEVTV